MDSGLSAPGLSLLASSVPVAIAVSLCSLSPLVSHTVPNTILRSFASSCNRSSLCIPVGGKPCGTQAGCFLLGKLQGPV